jgi:type IV secretion system protein VirB5
VQVTSIVRASDRSFQVKWTESDYERGSLAGTSRWTAFLSVLVEPPASAETLRKNPLGLYVDGIDWSRELDVPAPNVPAAPSRALPRPSSALPLGSPLDPDLGAHPVPEEPPERTSR